MLPAIIGITIRLITCNLRPIECVANIETIFEYGRYRPILKLG